MNAVTKFFLLPGDLIAGLLHASKADDRVMIRTLVNMLFWNFVVVLAAAVIYL
ncbi:MAG TPA: hypothetical protein VFG62_22900 [Rhodopila sp.]|jgi:hypothetical protein|nr:hypothetical protein [Rhodopila sp.]